MGIPLWGPLNPGVGVNLFAGALQALCVGLLLQGVELGKHTINFFTIIKMALVLFMIIAGLCLFKPSNVTNWAPKGSSGILRGATSAFFGYLGYDEVSTYMALAITKLRKHCLCCQGLLPRSRSKRPPQNSPNCRVWHYRHSYGAVCIRFFGSCRHGVSRLCSVMNSL